MSIGASALTIWIWCCSTGKRSSPLLSELAAKVVQVIAAAAQNVDSVPEPDEAIAKLKHSRAQAASAQTPPPAPVPSATSAAPVPSVGGKADETDNADVAQTPAANASIPEITGGQKAPAPQSSNGSAAVMELAAAVPELSQTGAAEGAATPPAMQPKAGALQPKQLPLLVRNPQRSGGLFRPAGLLHQQAPANNSAFLPQRPVPDVPPAGAALAKPAQPAERPAAATSLGAADAVQQHDSSAAVGQLSLQQEGAVMQQQQQSLRAQATGLGALLGCSRTPRPGAGMAMLGMSSGAPKSGRSTNKVCSQAD